MAETDAKIIQQQRQKTQLAELSNYENAVTFICSLEAWFNYRWGPSGKAQPNLLRRFDRFPLQDGLTPDFVAYFATPYVLWGDHKRIFPSVSTGRTDAADQIIKYAKHCALRSAPRPATESTAAGTDELPSDVPHDIVVIVKPENDRVAAEAIDERRRVHALANDAEAVEAPGFAPIVVLGCYRDLESINGHWYNLHWRSHHGNCRFTSPNVSSDETVEDLNGLLVDATHHAIPVSRSALGLTTRHPFINDRPPAIYTAIRLIIPAISDVLTDEERDQLASDGKIEKIITRNDLLASSIVKLIQPQPKGFAEWIEAGLRFLTLDVRCGKIVNQSGGSDLTRYSILVDRKLIGADASQLFALRASRSRTERQSARRKGRRGADYPGQLGLFG